MALSDSKTEGSIKDKIKAEYHKKLDAYLNLDANKVKVTTSQEYNDDGSAKAATIEKQSTYPKVEDQLDWIIEAVAKYVTAEIFNALKNDMVVEIKNDPALTIKTKLDATAQAKAGPASTPGLGDSVVIDFIPRKFGGGDTNSGSIS